MQQENPYAPPVAHGEAMAPEQPWVDEGSYGLGLTLGIIFGLWGWIGCAIFGKYETKRGAKHGFLGRLGFVVFLVMVMVVVDAM